MNVSSTQLLADRDLWFADWGETVTFREVSETYTPETQAVVESHTDTQLTAIVSEGRALPAAGTAAAVLRETLIVVIKAEDLPTADPTVTSRIVHDGTEYEIVSFDRSAADLVYTLHCRRR